MNKKHDAIPARCESYRTNFKRCLKTATHREICPNGIEYYCDHHADMRRRDGTEVEVEQIK